MKIAIIPARGGSKRLPGKNIKLLANRPLIAWTIGAAIESEMFDHVYVSTDCDEIALISKQYGAEVPFLRPSNLANDNATTDDVVTHLVDWFENKFSQPVSLITILQPTSPLRNYEHIKQAHSEMRNKSAKAIVSVCELEHPIQFCNQLGVENSMEGFIDTRNIKRTQDLEPTYRLNGAIYMFHRCYVGRMEEIYSEGTFAYIMNRELSIDIDTLDDFKLASYYLSSHDEDL